MGLHLSIVFEDMIKSLFDRAEWQRPDITILALPTFPKPHALSSFHRDIRI